MTFGPLHWFGLAAVVAIVLALVAGPAPSFAEEGRAIPAPAVDAAPSGGLQMITLAGGCFWGVQAVYQHLDGVASAVSGYAGGSKDTATYDKVSGGDTGHAEAVRVTFDPAKVSLGRILQVFFSVAHDPTQLDRQGPDIGAQYRSAIFANSAEQTKIAEAYVAQLSKDRAFSRPIVTRIEQGKAFYAAEAYHQDYLVRNPRNPYIIYNDLPKIAALKRLFPTAYLDRPTLVASRATN